MATRSTYRLKISKRRFRSYFQFPDIAKCHRDNDCLFAVSFHVDLPIWPLGRSVQNANALSVISINYLISLFGTLKISLSLSLSSFTLVIAEIIRSSKKRKVYLLYVLILFFFLLRRSKSKIICPRPTTIKAEKIHLVGFEKLFGCVVVIFVMKFSNDVLKWSIGYERKWGTLNLSILITVKKY